MIPSLRATLTGNVLTLDYAYPPSFADKFEGPPWAATLLVAIDSATAYPACRRLGSAAVRTEGPAEKDGLVRARAEVDLVAFWGLTPGLVRYAHASFLQAITDVVRISG